MTPSAAVRGGSALFHLTIIATVLLAWTLCHPYQGLFHDANLYSLQALAHLYPDSLSHDVFLKYGSQDRFTAFSPLYAAAISMLGIDRAAATLTLLSQVTLLAAAFALASTCIPRRAVAAGLVLLIAMPCDYGPERIFACVEPFLTPRMLAEALTLCMLAASLRKRLALATLLGLAAMAVHPVMALAGPAAIVIHAILHRGFWAHTAFPVALGGALLVAGLCAVFIGGRFDTEWLTLVAGRSPYLFLSDWGTDDWIRAGTTASTLLLAALSLPAPVGKLSRVVLLMMVAGWVITVVGADLTHGVLLTQLQTWRWQWLGSAASAMLLPYLLYSLWCSGPRGRSVALAIAATWIFRDGSYALVALLVALGLRLAPPLRARRERLLFSGTVALVLLAVVWRTVSNLEFTDVHYMDGTLPLALRRTMSFAKDGALLAAVAGCAVLLDRHKAIGMQWALFLGLLAATVIVLPFTASGWLSRSYTDTLAAKFAPWRELIPPQAEVLWNESPLGSWALLRRAHYISGLQTSGLVFSRAAALELSHRAETLAGTVPSGNFLQWSSVGLTLPLSPQGLQSVCRLGIIGFLVTAADLGIEPIAQLNREDWPVSRGLKLYRCSG